MDDNEKKIHAVEIIAVDKDSDDATIKKEELEDILDELLRKK